MAASAMSITPPLIGCIVGLKHLVKIVQRGAVKG
jgi:ABC-type glycerol-3-phosphate transport system permease component